jgi:hypothetical protein
MCENIMFEKPFLLENFCVREILFCARIGLHGRTIYVGEFLCARNVILCEKCYSVREYNDV